MQTSSFVPAKRASSTSTQVRRESTGIPTFDCLIGGGLLNRSICIVEEDVLATYCDIFVRTFLASTITNGQNCIVVSLKRGNSFVSLPSPVDVNSQVPLDVEQPVASEKLNIAWRYENKPMQTDELLVGARSATTVFDHSKTCELTPEQKRLMHNISINAIECEANHGASALNSSLIDHRIYVNCLRELERVLDEIQRKNVNKSACRVVLKSVGPSWYVGVSDTCEARQFTLFLLALRTLLQRFDALALITIDPLFPVRNLATISDYLFCFESFEARRAALRAAGLTHIDGLLHVRKLSRFGALKKAATETLDVAFSMKNGRQLVVQRVSLPPDLGGDDTSTATASKQVADESQRTTGESDTVRLPSDEEDEVDEDMALELSSAVRTVSLPCSSNVVINPRRPQLDF